MSYPFSDHLSVPTKFYHNRIACVCMCLQFSNTGWVSLVSCKFLKPHGRFKYRDVLDMQPCRYYSQVIAEYMLFVKLASSDIDTLHFFDFLGFRRYVQFALEA